MSRDFEIAPDYDGARTSDNEYLHYINHKIGYGNERLDRLVTAVWVANMLLAMLVGAEYWGS